MMTETKKATEAENNEAQAKALDLIAKQDEAREKAHAEYVKQIPQPEPDKKNDRHAVNQPVPGIVPELHQTNEEAEENAKAAKKR